MSPWRIPLFDTRFGPEEEEAVLRPLRAGWLTMGDEVLRLEDELREATGARHAIAVSNGTAALQLACAALGIGPGDEVICPTLTFVATANAPRTLGARVSLVDSVGPGDLTLDPLSVRAALTDRTRAVMVVHYAGFPCRMEEILAQARAAGVAVIEDAAHAVFTRHRGRMLGLHGTLGCFSFYSNKNVTSGEGGAILTDDDELAASLRLLRSHGMTTPTLDRHRGVASSYDVVRAGYNMRLDEIRAALLRAQLRRLPGFLARRRELFQRYVELLSQGPATVPFTNGRFADCLGETGVHILATLLPAGADRTAVMSRLKEAGIQTSIHYPPIHQFQAYREAGRELRRTADLGARQLTLPFYPAMRDEDVRLVVEQLHRSLEACGF